MKHYQVLVSVPFNEELTDAECHERMLNWLKANDGTIVAVRQISEKDLQAM